MEVPDIKVAEIVDGELHVSPRPAPRHANAGSSLTALVGVAYHHGRGGPGGWFILAEPELHLGRDVLVPDIAGWRRSRMPRLPRTAYFPLAPEWVCEVLSPSTSAFDRAKKLGVYAREGVAHAWLVDPIVQTLEVMLLENGRWVILGTHAGTEVVRADPFSDIDLALGDLWAEEADS